MAETLTVNYSWTKPEIGASIDNWGGFINQDLDGIDSVVHGIQTTKYDASNPAGYIVDAPSDGTAYARKSAAWSHLTHNDITDWASAAAPPVKVQDTAPASPVAGSLWWDSVGGQLYCWVQDANSSQWVIAVNVAAALPPASTTVLGGVKVDGTTIKAAGDGTISTTVVPMGDNRIINGDMRIDQRNNGASGTANGYTIDRWQFNGTVASKGNWQRLASGALGFPYCLAFIANSSYALLAGDTFHLSQVIEADMVSDFAWGTANAQAVTLSFYAQSSLTGTFSGAILNTAGTRSYPFSYSIPVAGVATKIAVTIPGDTAGTWVLSGNAGSISVRFSLGTGTTYSGPAGAWAATTYNAATGAVSVVSTNGASFSVTGVKLEIGSVATPFNRQSLAKSMADCQRYYQQLGGPAQYSIVFQGYSSGAAGVVSATLGIAAMRAAPTFNLVGTISNTNNSAVNVFLNPSTVGVQMVATAAGICSYYLNANSYWTLTAEL